MLKPQGSQSGRLFLGHVLNLIGMCTILQYENTLLFLLGDKQHKGRIQIIKRTMPNVKGNYVTDKVKSLYTGK